MTARGALVLAALLFAGCGPTTRSGEPPRAPSAPAGNESPTPGYGAPASTETQSVAPGSGEKPASNRRAAPDNGAPPSSKDDRDIEQAMPTLEDALSAFEQASGRLSTSGNDCRIACQALGSMRRSADRICELEPAGPEDRCEHARQRVKDAEKRVHSGCGEC